MCREDSKVEQQNKPSVKNILPTSRGSEMGAAEIASTPPASKLSEKNCTIAVDTKKSSCSN